MAKYKFKVYLKNIGIFKFSSSKQDINDAINTQYFNSGFTKFLKKYNLTILQYINDNIQKL